MGTGAGSSAEFEGLLTTGSVGSHGESGTAGTSMRRAR